MKICGTCGSHDLIYFCTAKFNPNDDYKYIEMCDPLFDDAFEWCNSCGAHTIFEEKDDQ